MRFNFVGVTLKLPASPDNKNNKNNENNGVVGVHPYKGGAEP